MHPSALEKSGFTTTLNMALSSTAPERSAEMMHRKQLARFGKWLYRLGFVPGTAGNLSVRLSHDRILASSCSRLQTWWWSTWTAGGSARAVT
jgi:Class II Aldolase and Adducin N-terminal domain